MKARYVTVLTGGAFLALATLARAHPAQPLEEVPPPPGEVSAWWMVGAAASLVMAITFIGIAWFLWKALFQGGQWFSNPLLLGFTGIFTFCAFSHLIHFEHAMLPLYAPLLGLEDPIFTAEFGQWGRATLTHPWVLAVDVGTAAMGVLYFTIRREQGQMFRGAELSEDLRVLETEAKALQDSVVQSSAQALLLIDEGRDEEALECLEETIGASKTIVDQFFGEKAGGTPKGQDISIAKPEDGA